MAVMKDKFGSGDGEAADEILEVFVDAKVHRVVRMVDAADRVRAVFLGAEEIEFAARKFDDERAFG